MKIGWSLMRVIFTEYLPGVELPAHSGVTAEEVRPNCEPGRVVRAGEDQVLLVDLLKELLVAVPGAGGDADEDDSVFGAQTYIFG